LVNKLNNTTKHEFLRVFEFDVFDGLVVNTITLLIIMDLWIGNSPISVKQ